MNTDAKPKNLTIFISHKLRAARMAAETIREKFLLYGSNRLTFLIAEEMPAGEHWRQWIKEKVAQADIMLFLCTCPDEEWDWCVYEAGIFTGLSEIEKKHLILLYSPVVNLPDPLSDIQSVEAKPQSMKGFLRKFFGTDTYASPPINTAFAENDTEVTKVATSLCQLFATAAPMTRYFGRYITLNVEQPDLLKEGNIPNDLMIESDALSLGLLFDLGENPVNRPHWTWQDIKSRITNGNQNWLKSLGTTLASVIQHGAIDKPIIETFQAPRTGKNYSIVLESLDTRGSGIMKFRILFAEQSAKSFITAADERFSTLLSSMILGNRLQWEVCNHYLFLLKNQQTLDKRIYKELEEKMMTIEHEAQTRRTLEFQRQDVNERLVCAFEAGDKRRSEIEENLTKQNISKKGVTNAIAAANANELEENLAQLKVLNNQLMMLITMRYNELLSSIAEVAAVTPESTGMKEPAKAMLPDAELTH